MVVFTCQHCGASLNKNKVEKHYNFECRNNPFVTCVDCLKDFRDTEYVAHTECVTEDQKYGGKDYVAKTPSSVKKRATWLSSVESSLERKDLTNQQKKFIQSLLKHSNLPQKKKKFENFLKSAMGRNCPDVNFMNNIFDILEETHKRNVENEKKENNSINVSDVNGENDFADNEKTDINKSSCNLNGITNGSLDTSSTDKKKKKKKHSKTENELNENGNEVDLSKDDSFIADDKNVENKEKALENGSSDVKLSKKERKEKKKRAKYEAQLNEIENIKPVEEDIEENEEQDLQKTKKNKKDKGKKSKEENDLIEKESSSTKNSKKKRCMSENEVEPSKKKTKSLKSDDENDNEINDEETNNEAVKVSFNWNNAIIQLLEMRDDKEMPVNRLTKKIINEYYAIYGENHMTYEKLLVKFNKKLHKTPGVKVLKDKAKLVSISEA